MSDLLTGIRDFGRALGFAFRHGMGWLFLVPIVLWVLFAAGVFVAGDALVAHIGAWTEMHLGLDIPVGDTDGWQGFCNDVKAVIDGARDLIVLLAMKVALFYLFSLLGKYLVLFVLSPVLAYASERTGTIITGVEHPFRLGRFLRDMLRGMGMVVRNAVLELVLNGAVWMGTLFVPLLTPLSALVLWLVSCWFYGFSMFDYVFERQGLGARASSRAARSRAGAVLGNGMAFSLLMKLPFVGMVLAPPMAAIGAVLTWHRTDRTRQTAIP